MKSINNQELIITNKKAVKRTLNMAIIFIIACLVIMGAVYRVPSMDGVKIFILGVLSCLLLFFIFRFFQFFKLYISKTPAMIINNKGIWIKEYDFIPWSKIASIDEYNPIKIPGFSNVENEMPALGIRLHDPRQTYEKASRIGKRYLLIAFKFNQPYHITLIDMDMHPDRIAKCAEHLRKSFTDSELES